MHRQCCLFEKKKNEGKNKDAASKNDDVGDDTQAFFVFGLSRLSLGSGPVSPTARHATSSSSSSTRPLVALSPTPPPPPQRWKPKSPKPEDTMDMAD